MVGFLNAYQLSSNPTFLEASLQSWRFIQNDIIDQQYGEWFWAVSQNGVPHHREKVGPWKTAYHNSRACIEVMQRTARLMNNKT